MQCVMRCCVFTKILASHPTASTTCSACGLLWHVFFKDKAVTPVTPQFSRQFISWHGEYVPCCLQRSINLSPQQKKELLAGRHYYLTKLADVLRRRELLLSNLEVLMLSAHLYRHVKCHSATYKIFNSRQWLCLCRQTPCYVRNDKCFT